jgi:glycosyltransferase involved in cell wall biosynthesis
MMAHNSILFSIILPTYNRGELLTKAISSVLTQTYTNWELIIIDDGSTDNTAEIVGGLSAKDKRIKYYYQDNAERSAARNNGITKATGDYVCFLDSDDAFSPEHLFEIEKAIVKNKNNSYIYISLSKTIYSKNVTEEKSNLVLGANDFETVLLNAITPGQICVAKNVIQNCLFNTNITISEDTELFFRLLDFAPLKILKVHTFLYYQHNDNSVNVKKHNAFAERKKTLELILTYRSSRFVSKKVKQTVVSNCYFGIAKHYVANKKIWSARLAIMEAILLYPTISLKEKIYLLFNTTTLVDY